MVGREQIVGDLQVHFGLHVRRVPTQGERTLDVDDAEHPRVPELHVVSLLAGLEEEGVGRVTSPVHAVDERAVVEHEGEEAPGGRGRPHHDVGEREVLVPARIGLRDVET